MSAPQPPQPAPPLPPPPPPDHSFHLYLLCRLLHLSNLLLPRSIAIAEQEKKTAHWVQCTALDGKCIHKDDVYGAEVVTLHWTSSG